MKHSPGFGYSKKNQLEIASDLMNLFYILSPSAKIKGLISFNTALIENHFTIEDFSELVLANFFKFQHIGTTSLHPNKDLCLPQ